MSEFVTVAKVSDIPEGASKRVSVDGQPIALFHVQGKFYATDDVCTHAEASLAEGNPDGFQIECRKHGARFDIRTGEVLKMPAIVPISTFEVRVEGDDVQVAVDVK